MDQINNNLDQGESSEQNKSNDQSNMASLLADEGLGINMPKAGDIKHGTIASITPGQILVSVGAKSEGIISGHEFEVIPPEEFAAMQVGQEIPVFVINAEAPVHVDPVPLAPCPGSRRLVVESLK